MGIACTKCGETDRKKFYKNGTSWCGSCQREAVRDGRYRKLGISREQYLAILHGQCGACAICGEQEQPVAGTHRGLHLDHDHETGKARGILCSRCNQLLGRVREDVSLLMKFVDYLRLYGK